MIILTYFLKIIFTIEYYIFSITMQRVVSGLSTKRLKWGQWAVLTKDTFCLCVVLRDFFFPAKELYKNISYIFISCRKSYFGKIYTFIDSSPFFVEILTIILINKRKRSFNRSLNYFVAILTFNLLCSNRLLCHSIDICEKGIYIYIECSSNNVTFCARGITIVVFST